MTTVPALQTSQLGKRYGHKWGLQDCSFALPKGRVAALVGPNGAGKTTLLRMVAGITRPSAGRVSILGHSTDAEAAEVLGLIGYLDQERPLYRGFRVQEILRMGRSLNPSWDDTSAHEYLDRLGIQLAARVGSLSIGHQAQVAMTLCLAKRPQLLLLDEPMAALDPLAREQLMQVLMGHVAEDATTVVIASHVLSDLESICDYLIILSASRVQIADDLEHVLASHRLLVGPRRETTTLPRSVVLVSSANTERQSSWLVRTERQITDPTLDVMEPTLQEIVLAYLRQEHVGRRGEGGRDQ
jgi:ABC-2 type transport system ATP-binding protein